MSYQSPDIAALAAALATAQADLSAVTKNREVSVRTRDGGTYKFKYATFDAIIEHVRKALTANGLWFTQTMAPFTSESAHFEGRFIVLTTTLYHKSGQWISSEILVPDVGTNQELGSSLTYRKRYALASLLGLGSEEDDDANAADGNTIKATEEKARAEPEEDSAIKRRAKTFGEGALAILKACTGKAQFEHFYTSDNRTRIARLKDFYPELHKQIVAEVEKCEAMVLKEERG